MDTQAARARCEAATKSHQELEAIPKSVCLGCGALEGWPCDAVGLAADCTAALEALEEARQFREKIQKASDQYGYSHSEEFMNVIFAILREGE